MGRHLHRQAQRKGANCAVSGGCTALNRITDVIRVTSPRITQRLCAIGPQWGRRCARQRVTPPAGGTRGPRRQRQRVGGPSAVRPTPASAPRCARLCNLPPFRRARPLRRPRPAPLPGLCRVRQLQAGLPVACQARPPSIRHRPRSAVVPRRWLATAQASPGAGAGGETPPAGGIPDGRSARQG